MQAARVFARARNLRWTHHRLQEISESAGSFRISRAEAIHTAHNLVNRSGAQFRQ
jgi:hypothetical protein